jgi:hypothetical protein
MERKHNNSSSQTQSTAEHKMAEFERLKSASLEAVQLKIAQVGAKESPIHNTLVRLLLIFSEFF